MKIVCFHYTNSIIPTSRKSGNIVDLVDFINLW